MTTTTNARLRGLDVSACQGFVRWQDVPSDFVFVVAKATEGTFYKDPMFDKNVEGIHATGRVFAPYHFCRPSQDPLAQIRAFWKAIGAQMPDLRPVLDLENAPDDMPPAKVLEWFMAAADEAEAHFGVPPEIYSDPWFFKTRLLKALTAAIADRLARCPFFPADYSKGESPPATVDPLVLWPWKTWTMWQTSGNASSRVPGIAGAVDHDLFNGDLEAFRAFRGLPPLVTVQDDPIVHPIVEFPSREYDSDPTLPCAAAPSSSSRMPPVEIVDDAPGAPDDDPPPQAA